MRASGVIRDGWRVISEAVLEKMVDMDPELEAFIPFSHQPTWPTQSPRADLAKLAASAPPVDVAGMEIEDRTVAADPDVPVRIYRPQQAQGVIVWLHGGGFVMGDLDTDHPYATRLASRSAVTALAPGSRPRWRCGPATSRGQRSDSSCSTSRAR